MTEPQLDLVTLTLSPNEARMVATALQMRSLTIADNFRPEYKEAVKKIGKRYEALRRKVEYQSGASNTP